MCREEIILGSVCRVFALHVLLDIKQTLYSGNTNFIFQLEARELSVGLQDVLVGLQDVPVGLQDVPVGLQDVHIKVSRLSHTQL